MNSDIIGTDQSGESVYTGNRIVPIYRDESLSLRWRMMQFATTITLSSGVPLETISNILGHATLRQTQHYAKVVALKIKTDMTKLEQVYQDRHEAEILLNE